MDMDGRKMILAGIGLAVAAGLVGWWIGRAPRSGGSSGGGGTAAAVAFREGDAPAATRGVGAERAQARASRPPAVYALLIGIDKSPAGRNLSNLRCAVADVALLEETLVNSVGVPLENIRTLKDERATAKAIGDALATLEHYCGPNDVVIVAYSGHGGLDGASNASVLETHEARLRVGDLLSRLGQVPAAKRLLLIDACRSGEPSRVSFTASRYEGQGLAWIAACSASESSYEVESNGLFMGELARAMSNSGEVDQDNDGQVSFGELADYTRKKVSGRAVARGWRQTPTFGVINWRGDQNLMAAKHKWTIGLGSPPTLVSIVKGTLDPQAMKQGHELWLVVAPKLTPGAYYPQPRGQMSVRGQMWDGSVYLGQDNEVGQVFSVHLIEADRSLSDLFDAYLQRGANDGRFLPPLERLPKRATLTVTRQ